MTGGGLGSYINCLGRRVASCTTRNRVDWIATSAFGGDGMAADAARLFSQQQE